MPERTEMLATYSFAKSLKSELSSFSDAKLPTNKMVTRNDIFQKYLFGFSEETAPHCDTGTKNVA
jgi:hypothetical protein